MKTKPNLHFALIVFLTVQAFAIKVSAQADKASEKTDKQFFIENKGQ